MTVCVLQKKIGVTPTRPSDYRTSTSSLIDVLDMPYIYMLLNALITTMSIPRGAINPRVIAMALIA